ncbi:MAG: hypothetical protein L3K26_00765 [Candidatus Hydrogenedentes bacterium]|nr:hypothetical protein [Candidatus Hydrogenedentota bacterium]
MTGRFHDATRQAVAAENAEIVQRHGKRDWMGDTKVLAKQRYARPI